MYWPSERVRRQGNQPPDARQPQLYVPEGPPADSLKGGQAYDLAFAALPWVKTHFSQGEYSEWLERFRGVEPPARFQVHSEEKCTDCGFLYLSAKLGAFFGRRTDSLRMASMACA